MKTLLKFSCAMLLAALSVNCSARSKITITVSGIEKQIYLPVKLAQQLGFLKESGLEVEFLDGPAGAYSETGMLSGASDGAIGFYDHTITLQARGKLVQSVVQFTQAPGEVLLVSKAAGTIKSAADLKGKRLGVTALGSSTNFLTHYLAATAGVKSSEFSTVPVGAGASFMSAMTAGRIDAGMTTEPTVSRMLGTGAASILVDLRSVKESEAALGGPYPGACLYMPNAWVNAHKDEVQKIVNAFVKTLKYIHTHSAKEIAEQMPPEYYASDRQLYIDALERSKPMFTADGLMPENGPSTVLKILQSFDRAVQRKSINLEATFTNEFVKAAK